jgi:hypothetical protein
MRNIKAELLQDGATKAQADKIAKEIMSTLAVYETTRIWYENGEYNSTPHAILTATYAADRRMVTTIKDNEVYTPEQLKANLAELSKATWMD